MSGKNPNKVEAEKIALSLDSDRNTLINRLTKKGFTEAQINQLNVPDIKIGETIDPKIYSPKTLERFKKAGLDIGQFAKDRGFYVDVKKAKPFWESNIRNTIVAAAQNNTGNVCNIFAGKIAFSKEETKNEEPEATEETSEVVEEKKEEKKETVTPDQIDEILGDNQEEEVTAETETKKRGRIDII